MSGCRNCLDHPYVHKSNVEKVYNKETKKMEFATKIL